MPIAIAPHPFGPASSHAGTRAEIDQQHVEAIELTWRALRRLGIPDPVLPDAVQDALLVLHRRRDDFRGEANFRTWVYGVVLRIASNYRRQARRTSAVFDTAATEALEAAPSAIPSPFEQLELRSATALLHQLLDELPEDVRAVFVLVELEELSIEQAAAALQLRATTCKSRLRTARRLFDAASTRERARLERRMPR